ncbi:MAG: hypothetical protein DCO96_10280 [Fluviicola sp. XM-24bin1]|nr:MAG: hypothetical protein DCO96_10280 [Fluviicola sp. XM-24bin1]
MPAQETKRKKLKKMLLNTAVEDQTMIQRNYASRIQAGFRILKLQRQKKEKEVLSMLAQQRIKFSINGRGRNSYG